MDMSFFSGKISNNFSNFDQIVTRLNNLWLNNINLTRSISISGYLIGLPLCKVVLVNLFVSSSKYFFSFFIQSEIVDSGTLKSNEAFFDYYLFIYNYFDFWIIMCNLLPLL